jgi:S1-C subfamily serine protease
LESKVIGIEGQLADQRQFTRQLRDALEVMETRMSRDEIEATVKKVAASCVTVFLFNERTGERVGNGSGVVIQDLAGKQYIITNDHVVNMLDELESKDPHGIYVAPYTGTDGFKAYKTRVAQLPDNRPARSSRHRHDLALLEIPPNPKFQARPAELWDVREDLPVGHGLIAVGSPFGQTDNVTSGTVSHTNRTLDAPVDLIQTTAKINRGNSGGGSFSTQGGKLIGINTAIHSRDEGMSYMIPPHRMKTVLQYDFGLPFMTPREQATVNLEAFGRQQQKLANYERQQFEKEARAEKEKQQEEVEQARKAQLEKRRIKEHEKMKRDIEELKALVTQQAEEIRRLKAERQLAA